MAACYWVAKQLTGRNIIYDIREVTSFPYSWFYKLGQL